ncbi:helix-turn-helix transcriptional regulator [Amycolatopsis sp. NPDC049159]|uniref:helix-turn-helix domain-containing protein n=1 Tax=Amycolatopsis sp. NPDC049159 TaxID=3157210 RepID=UPI0033D85980
MAGTKGTLAVTLGAEMRDARKKYLPDSTVRSMSDLLGVQHPTVSRWETGERKPRPEDVAAYMVAIGAPAAKREELVEMARGSSSKPMLEDQGKYAAMLEIARTAKELVHVAPALLPGMLQTEPYARAVFVETGLASSLIDTRVAVRLGQQTALTRRYPLIYRAFIWEPVLHAALIDGESMSDQLKHLLVMGERPNVHVRIIPMCVKWNPGWEGPFSVATFPDEVERGPVVQLENKVSALYLEAPADVDLYQSDARRAEEVAISSEESAELIASVINSKETTT